MSKYLWHFAKLFFGLAILAGLAYAGTLKLDELFAAITGAPLLFLAVLLTYFFCIVLISFRWYFLVKAAGLIDDYFTVFRLHMIGQFFTLILPGGLGGDMARGFYIFRRSEEGRQAVSVMSVIMDRALGFYGLTIFSVLMSALNYDFIVNDASLSVLSLIFAGLFAGITAGLLFFLFFPGEIRLDHRLLDVVPGGKLFRSLAGALLFYRNHKRAILYGAAISLVSYFTLASVVYLAGSLTGIQLGFAQHGQVLPTVVTVNTLPVSPGGIGVGEAASEYMYRRMGVADGGSEIMVLYHAGVLFSSLIGWPFYIFASRRRREEEEQAKEDSATPG